MPLMSPSLPNSPPQVPEKPQETVVINKQSQIPVSQVNENAIEVLKAANIDQRRGRSRMSPLLVQEGLGLEECARKLTTFATYSEDENIQFQATKLALQLHGELEKEGKESNTVQINFVGVTPDLLQVLIPRG